jgi:hypothetical protein
MSETSPPLLSAAAGSEAPALIESTGETASLTRAPLLERTIPLLALFIMVGAVMMTVAFLSVHRRQPAELAEHSTRTHTMVTRWMAEGYFHYAGLLLDHPTNKTIYVSWGGAYLVPLFVIESLHHAVRGHYSWKLAALYSQMVSLLVAALTGLLAYRISRRIGLDAWPALASGAAVVMLIFTFPGNLALYWNLSFQATWLLFAIAYLLIEERCLDGRRPALDVAQAGTAFLMAMMEGPAALMFLAALGLTLFVLEQRPGQWKRFVMISAIPMIAAVGLNVVQVKIAKARFPDWTFKGNTLMFRTGLDGDTRHYGDHLDIARRRDGPRRNWTHNREYLFRWPTVFFMGAIATLLVFGAYATGRAPRFAVEALAALTGTWFLYAAIFSQGVKIHPWLYDVLLYTPLVVALFALAPALGEIMSRRTGAIILIAVFCACWYTMFQMRLYALWYPAADVRAAATKAR